MYPKSLPTKLKLPCCTYNKSWLYFKFSRQGLTLCCHQIGEKLCPQQFLYMMSSELLAFKLERKAFYLDHKKTQKFKLCCELTFLIFWVGWIIVSDLVIQLKRLIRRSEKCEEGPHTEWKYAVPQCGGSVLGPPSFSPYLWLVPLTNTFLCWFWQHVALYTLPRLCRLNNTLQPVSPLLPQGTTTHTGQSEGNDFDFLPLFTHQMGKKENEGARWSWPSWINKPLLQCVHAHMYFSVINFVCVCGGRNTMCVLRNRWVHFFLLLL